MAFAFSSASFAFAAAAFSASAAFTASVFAGAAGSLAWTPASEPIPRPAASVTAIASFFMVLSPSMLNLRRGAGFRGRLAGFDVVVPELVVLPGPGLIGDAVAHIAVGALHPDGAHVDVAEREQDHDHGRNCVDHVGLLHGGPQLLEIREQHDHSGPPE